MFARLIKPSTFGCCIASYERWQVSPLSDEAKIGVGADLEGLNSLIESLQIFVHYAQVVEKHRSIFFLQTRIYYATASQKG